MVYINFRVEQVVDVVRSYPKKYFDQDDDSEDEQQNGSVPPPSQEHNSSNTINHVFMNQ